MHSFLIQPWENVCHIANNPYLSVNYISPSWKHTFSLQKNNRMKNECLPLALLAANFGSLQILPNATRPHQHDQSHLLSCTNCREFKPWGTASSTFVLGRPGQVLTGAPVWFLRRQMCPQEIHWHCFSGSCCSETGHLNLMEIVELQLSRGY